MFLARFMKISPEYMNIHEENILKITVHQGGQLGYASQVVQEEQNKFFRTKYELYMYAILLGMQHDRRIPLAEGIIRNKFMAIESWRPIEIVHYIIMGLISKSNIKFAELEYKDATVIDEIVRDMRKAMEEYANGGINILFDMMRNNPDFFISNEDILIKLLRKNNTMIVK